MAKKNTTNAVMQASAGARAVQNIAKTALNKAGITKATYGKNVSSGKFVNNLSQLGQKTTSFGNAIVDQAAQGYASIASQGAGLANATSAAAQQAAMEFNAQQASNANALTMEYFNKAMAYNSAEAAKAREYNTQMYERALADNIQQAKESRDWQEMMSSTAYQRAVKDMQAAGINPILAYTQGGASSPTGATVSMGTGSSASANIGGASGIAANVGGYSGQGYSGSETLAMMAAVLGGLSSGLKAIQEGSDTINEVMGYTTDEFENDIGRKILGDKGYAKLKNTLAKWGLINSDGGSWF